MKATMNNIRLYKSDGNQETEINARVGISPRLYHGLQKYIYRKEGSFLNAKMI